MGPNKARTRAAQIEAVHALGGTQLLVHDSGGLTSILRSRQNLKTRSEPIDSIQSIFDLVESAGSTPSRNPTSSQGRKNKQKRIDNHFVSFTYFLLFIVYTLDGGGALYTPAASSRLYTSSLFLTAYVKVAPS
jgi:hypothetical protein